MGVRSRLGLGIGVETVVLGDTVVGAGPEVRHHHVPADPGLLRGGHRGDRRVAVHRIGAFGIPSACACGPDHRVVAAQQLGDLGDVHLLDVGDDGRATGSAYIVGVIGIADERTGLVTGIGQQPLEMQRDLAVSSEECDSCHGDLLTMKWFPCSMPGTGHREP